MYEVSLGGAALSGRAVRQGCLDHFFRWCHDPLDTGGADASPLFDCKGLRGVLMTLPPSAGGECGHGGHRLDEAGRRGFIPGTKQRNTRGAPETAWLGLAAAGVDEAACWEQMAAFTRASARAFLSSCLPHSSSHG